MLKKLFMIALVAMTMVANLFFVQNIYAATRAFNSTVNNLQQGMVVRQAQSEKGPLQLEPASSANGSHVVGVTTKISQDPDKPDANNRIVLVEAQGEVAALVANKTGDIMPGDKLTLSSAPGILVKLNDQLSGVVIATAKEAFDPARAQTLQLEGGPITVSSIKVEFGASGSSGPVDKASAGIRQFGEGVLKKDLSEARLAFAFLLSMVILIISSVIIYGAIANALFATGRNPLAKRAILTIMARTLAIGLVLLAAGLVGVYLILTV